MDIHKIIHDALYEFIQSYIPDADLRWALPPSSYCRSSGLWWPVVDAVERSTLDDVLLSYITGVLEDLGSQQSVEENFDVEVFAEMLEAYIPGFAEIDRWSHTFVFRNNVIESGFYFFPFYLYFYLLLFCSVKVCEMMFSLASKLASARTSGKMIEANAAYLTISIFLPFPNYFLIFLLQSDTFWAVLMII